MVKCFTDFPGHFPGDPLVPGAALLSWVEESLETQGWTLIALGRTRFLAPVRPGEELQLQLERTEQRVVFVGIRGEEVVFRGTGTVSVRDRMPGQSQ